MVDLDKSFMINATDYILSIHENYVTMTSIKRVELNELKNHVNKSITFNMWDDFSFNVYYDRDYYREINSISFDFDIDDPLYFCINRLLNNKDSLIIEDDETPRMQKYMEISKKDTKIVITFYNNVEDKERELPMDQFKVFIKNVGPDPRSKIDNYDDKIRLIKFIYDLRDRMIEEYHQITIDEYLENKRIEKIRKRELR